jgi:hypothetical protein
MRQCVAGCQQHNELQPVFLMSQQVLPALFNEFRIPDINESDVHASPS